MNLTMTQRLSQKAFKMNIILELKDLSPQERNKKISELVGQEFNIPYSKKKYLSRATIYSWLKEYDSAENRDEALLRKERSDSRTWRKLTEPQKKALLRWRFENAYRTCEDLLEELLKSQLACFDKAPSVSVIRRFLRRHKLDRKTLTRQNLPSGKVRLSYEADYPNQIWLIDTKGSNIQIPDPKDPTKLIAAMPIVLMDDFSRFVVGMRYIHMGDENEEMVMSVVMEAFSIYGIPDILYTDRGSPYMGKALEKALTVLGCRILHTRPRDASAKGKVEKVMQLYFSKVDTELNAKNQSTTLNIEGVNEYAKAITYAYHQTQHRETEEMPSDRYLSHTGNFRHYASKEILSLLFLPITRSKVTKDNLILLHKRKYLMPVIGYDRKFVEVRSDVNNPDSVYIWFDNTFIGVATEYISQNDFLSRKKYVDSQKSGPIIEIPDASEVPEYNRLERKLLEYRSIKENETYINEELKRLQKQRADTKTQLTHAKCDTVTNDTAGITVSHSPKDQGAIVEYMTDSNLKCNVENIVKSSTEIAIEVDSGANSTGKNLVVEKLSEEWRADHCVYLFSILFRRVLDAQERFSIHRVFRQYGPFKEKMVRRVIGRLLGESHPTSDLNGYLEALRIESMSKEGDD